MSLNKSVADSCLAKLADDEPFFVIRAQDQSSVAVLQNWIDINSCHLGNDHPKVTGAAEIRDAMAAYHTKKLAD